jgi:hypothetical protein
MVVGSTGRDYGDLTCLLGDLTILQAYHSL